MRQKKPFRYKTHKFTFSLLPKKHVVQPSNKTSLIRRGLLEGPRLANHRQLPKLPAKAREVPTLYPVRIPYIVGQGRFGTLFFKGDNDTRTFSERQLSNPLQSRLGQ